MSYVKSFTEFLNEGVNDPNILKVFFMAGGPGSGKSFVADEIFGFPTNELGSVSYATGLKLINNDKAFEIQLKKAGLEAKKLAKYSEDPEMWDYVMSIRNRAKGITKTAQSNYINGRLGQVIDGTGKDFDKIKKLRESYKLLGYDSYMIFVNTSLEVALERNRNRDRVLPDEMIKTMWEEVQNNLGKYQNLFGTGNLIIIDNSSTNDNALRSVERSIKSVLKQPIKNPIGRKWIKNERSRS